MCRYFEARALLETDPVAAAHIATTLEDQDLRLELLFEAKLANPSVAALGDTEAASRLALAEVRPFLDDSTSSRLFLATVLHERFESDTAAQHERDRILDQLGREDLTDSQAADLVTLVADVQGPNAAIALADRILLTTEPGKARLDHRFVTALRRGSTSEEVKRTALAAIVEDEPYYLPAILGLMGFGAWNRADVESLVNMRIDWALPYYSLSSYENCFGDPERALELATQGLGLPTELHIPYPTQSGRRLHVGNPMTLATDQGLMRLYSDFKGPRIHDRYVSAGYVNLDFNGSVEISANDLLRAQRAVALARLSRIDEALNVCGQIVASLGRFPWEPIFEREDEGEWAIVLRRALDTVAREAPAVVLLQQLLITHKQRPVADAFFAQQVADWLSTGTSALAESGILALINQTYENGDPHRIIDRLEVIAPTTGHDFVYHRLACAYAGLELWHEAEANLRTAHAISPSSRYVKDLRTVCAATGTTPPSGATPRDTHAFNGVRDSYLRCERGAAYLKAPRLRERDLVAEREARSAFYETMRRRFGWPETAGTLDRVDVPAGLDDEPGRSIAVVDRQGRGWDLFLPAALGEGHDAASAQALCDSLNTGADPPAYSLLSVDLLHQLLPTGYPERQNEFSWWFAAQPETQALWLAQGTGKPLGLGRAPTWRPGFAVEGADYYGTPISLVIARQR